MNHKSQSGFVALVSLLVISAAVLAISISIVLLAITEVQSSFSYYQGQKALKGAQGCAEDALLRLHDDASYTGGTPAVGDAACSITVTGTNPNFTINVLAALSGPPKFTQALKLTVRRAGNHINILSWQHVE